jgi:cytochrome c553
MKLPTAAALLLALVVAPAAPAASQDAADPEGLAFFEQKIRPVLVDKCYSCHSAEAKKSKGELLVDSREGLLRGGENGPAVVPGDPEKSLLVRAVRWTDEDLKMPPKTRLPKAVVADLEAWVRRGAPDPRTEAGPAAARKAIDVEAARSSWAYRPLRPAAPPRAGHPVDAFLPPPRGAADLRRLARRAAFVLTGLPPRPEDVESLLADPSGYEAYVDRLLADPAYGERQARLWMDVARFAESHGFEQDYDRENAWHYRDFLIRAFNGDLPYDRFVRWQVAGDELSPQDPQAWMATGFLGAGAFPTQLTEAEFESARYDELDSMASTTATAFLATSLGCARCHDHKFDPLSAKDYYRLASAFTGAVRSMAQFPMDPDGDRAALEAWERERARLSAERDRDAAEGLPARRRDWIAAKGWERGPDPVWIVLEGIEAASAGGAGFVLQPDGSLLAGGKNPAKDLWTFKARLPVAGVRAIRLEALAHPSLPKQGPGRAPNGNFALGDFRVRAGGAPVALSLAARSFEQNAGNLSAAAAIDGDPKGTGWAVDPRVGKDHAIVLRCAAPLPAGDAVFELEFGVNAQHAIGRPRLSVSVREDPPLDGPSTAAAEARILEESRAGRLPALEAFRRLDPEARRLDEALAKHAAKRPAPRLTPVLVTSEGMKPLKHHADDRGFPHFYPETHFLARGDVNKKQGVATLGFPPVLTAPGTDASAWYRPAPAGSRTPGRRAAVAAWLTDEERGAGALAARVMANRLWAQHFGRGIVATVNDFGAQGEKPTHPELLEWLAGELVRGGWKLKRLHRLLATSAAFRASSFAGAAEPYARWEPRRLEAEQIRDALLEAGGLLDRLPFGPGTLDEGMTRRAVYFFQKRSRLIPMMSVFDAPEPLVSQGSRPTTTIAPQALIFMNSPLVRRCAGGLASAASDAAGAYRRALARPPSPAEAARAAAFLEAQEASYRKAGHADPAKAARTDLAQALLCLNEFVYLD